MIHLFKPKRQEGFSNRALLVPYSNGGLSLVLQLISNGTGHVNDENTIMSLGKDGLRLYDISTITWRNHWRNEFPLDELSGLPMFARRGFPPTSFRIVGS